jgi:hypothetical protein
VLSPRGGDSVTSGRSINHLFRSSGHDGGRAGLLPSSLVQPGPPLSQPASGGSSISSDFRRGSARASAAPPGNLVNRLHHVVHRPHHDSLRDRFARRERRRLVAGGKGGIGWSGAENSFPSRAGSFPPWSCRLWADFGTCH